MEFRERFSITTSHYGFTYSVMIPHQKESRKVQPPFGKSESFSAKYTRLAKVRTATPTNSINRPSSL